MNVNLSPFWNILVSQTSFSGYLSVVAAIFLHKIARSEVAKSALYQDVETNSSLITSVSIVT